MGQFSFLSYLCVFIFVNFVLKKPVNTKVAKGGHKDHKEEKGLNFKLTHYPNLAPIQQT